VRASTARIGRLTVTLLSRDRRCWRHHHGSCSPECADEPSIQVFSTTPRTMALKNLRAAARRTLRYSVKLYSHLPLTLRADKTFAPEGAQQTSFALILPSRPLALLPSRPLARSAVSTRRFPRGASPNCDLTRTACCRRRRLLRRHSRVCPGQRLRHRKPENIGIPGTDRRRDLTRRVDTGV
jgi:hypothetical protein